MDDFVHIGDTVSIHPYPLDSLTLYAEGAGSWAIKVNAPSKSRQRNLSAHLSFFTIELCAWTEAAAKTPIRELNRGDVVKIGDDITLRHVHTGMYFSASTRREDGNLTFELSKQPSPQTWVHLLVPSEHDLGQPLKYSHRFCLIFQLVSVNHYLSVISLDDTVTYNAFATAEQSFIVFRMVAGWGGDAGVVRCHQVVQLRHTKSQFLLAHPPLSDPSSQARLTSLDPSERIYWSFECLSEYQSGPLTPGHTYYLRNLSTGSYLTSSFGFSRVPGPNTAFILRSKTAGAVKQGQNEVFLETRDHCFLTCRESHPCYLRKSWVDFYQIPGSNIELTAEVTAEKADDGSEIINLEDVGDRITEFVRTEWDVVGKLREIGEDAEGGSGGDLELVAKAVESVVSMLNQSESGEELLRKQLFAAGTGAIEAAIKAGLAISRKNMKEKDGEMGREGEGRRIVTGLVEMVKGLVKRNQKVAASLFPLAPLLLELLPIDSFLIGRLLTSVFKKIDLQTSDQILHCRTWTDKLSHATADNVAEQTQMLKLLKCVAEVKGVPSFTSQVELGKGVLWEKTLLSVSVFNSTPWVHFSLLDSGEKHISMALSELSEEYVEYMYRALMLLVVVCHYNHAAAIDTMKGKMGFSDEFLLTYQQDESIPASIRAGLVHLSTALICQPAEYSSPVSLREPGNLVFSSEEIAQGLPRGGNCILPGAVEICSSLEVWFWTEKEAEKELPQGAYRSSLRLISAHLHQLLFLLSSGLASPRLCQSIRPALFHAALSLIPSVSTPPNSWPSSVLHLLVTSPSPSSEKSMNKIAGSLIQAISTVISLQTAYSVHRSLSLSRLSVEGEEQLSSIERLLGGWLKGSEEAGVEEIMLKLLFASRDGLGVDDIALGVLRQGGIQGRMLMALTHTIIVDCKEDAALWENLRIRINALAPFHLRAAYSESVSSSAIWTHIRDCLQAVLNLIFPSQYPNPAKIEKIRRMAKSLGLERLIRQLGTLVRDFHAGGFTEFWFEIVNLIVLLGTQCVYQHEVFQSDWVDFNPGLHFIAIPCSGLLIQQLTNFDYLRGSESQVAAHILREAVNVGNQFAARYTAFLMYLLTDNKGTFRQDVQLIVSYRVVEAIQTYKLLSHPDAEDLLLQLLHLLSLCARGHPLVHSHLRSCFSYSSLLASATSHPNSALAEGFVSLAAEIYKEEWKTIQEVIGIRLQALKGEQCFKELARWAGVGGYTKAWRRTEAGQPYSVHRYWISHDETLRCWEALYAEDVLGFETGFIVTIKRSGERLGSTQAVLEDILAGVRRMALSHPELCFTQLDSALASLLSSSINPTDYIEEYMTNDKELILSQGLLDGLIAACSRSPHYLPSPHFPSLAQKLLKIESFLQSAPSRSRFASAIKSITTHCASSSIPFLLALLTEVCRQIRDYQSKSHSSPAQQSLISSIWTSSSIVSCALTGVRKCSFRCIGSLRFLSEVTTDQTSELQSWLLTVLRDSGNYVWVFSLLKEALLGAVYAYAAGKETQKEAMETAKLLFRIVQNASESSFDQFQRFFLSQKGESGREPTVNVVQTIADFVVGGISAWRPGPAAPSIIKLVDPALETLINLITGPCVPSQSLLLVHSHFIRALMDFLRISGRPPFDDSTSTARYHISVLLNTLVEGELQPSDAKALLRNIDIPLLLKSIEDIYVECIEDREREIALETVTDGVRKTTIEFAFEVYTFLMEIREIDPRRFELQRLTAFPEKRVGRIMQLVTQYILPFKFSHSDCFGYFGSNVGYVEIARNGEITSMYFRIPPRCKYLSTETKEELANMDRTTRLDVLQKVLIQLPKLEAEMLHQQHLSRWPCFRVIVSLWRPMWVTCLVLVVCIDMVMLWDMTNPHFFRLQEIEGTTPQYVSILGAILSNMSIAHYIAYMIEYYPKIVVTVGQNSNLSFDLYPFIPHCDSVMMVPWVAYSSRTWIKRLPTLLSRLFRLIFSQSSFVRLSFIAFSFLSFRFPIFYSVMLLWFMSTNPSLMSILRAISTNFKQLVLTAAFCIIVIYAFTAIYYQSFTEYYEPQGEGNAQYSTYCTGLYTCFITNLNWGLRTGVGDALAQQFNETITLTTSTESITYVATHEYGSRLPLDLFFWILINVIILKIVFGIILDTFKELREARLRSEMDMAEKCFICNRTRSQLERLGNGWTSHFLHEHSLFAYIAYISYVGSKPEGRCSGIELSVKMLVERQDPAFFPETVKYFEKKGVKFEEEDED